MPYTLWGERFVAGCFCAGCRAIRGNVLGVGYLSHATPAAARVAYDAYVRREGPRADPSRVAIGRLRHLATGTNRTVRISRDANPGSCRQYVSRYRLDDFTAREMLRVLREDLPSSLVEAAAEPPSAEEVILGRYHRSDPRRNYTYKPDWIYYGDGPAYYGMELEVQCRDYRVMNWLLAEVGPCALLKNDSSIGGGFELVTHPMSYAWAMEHFPWDVLPRLEKFGCTIDPARNGFHVHVSRGAFKSQAHLLRWLKFFYRNQGQVTRIARRRSHYSDWNPDVQAGHFGHIKAEKARERVRAAEQRYRRQPSYDTEMTYAAATSELDALQRGDATRVNRYQAINTRNVTTLEVRVFASSLGITEVKAALQLVAAAVEYTRNISAHDVCGGGWGWLAFSTWLNSNKTAYPELVTADQYARMPRSPAARFSLASHPRRAF